MMYASFSSTCTFFQRRGIGLYTRTATASSQGPSSSYLGQVLIGIRCELCLLCAKEVIICRFLPCGEPRFIEEVDTLLQPVGREKEQHREQQSSHSQIEPGPGLAGNRLCMICELGVWDRK